MLALCFIRVSYNYAQKYASIIRQTLLGTHTAAYHDDMVIHSHTWKEHLHHIHTVLSRMRDANLTIKPKKCQFGNAQLHLSRAYHGRRKGQARPTGCYENTSDLQVRGLPWFNRKFIPEFATTAASLTDLIRKNSLNRVVWMDDCTRAFEKLGPIWPQLHEAIRTTNRCV